MTRLNGNTVVGIVCLATCAVILTIGLVTGDAVFVALAAVAAAGSVPVFVDSKRRRGRCCTTRDVSDDATVTSQQAAVVAATSSH
jgi:hypothetical protein